MNKTLIIIQREFMTRVKKKSFILLTILMPFIFAALIFVPLWLASIKDTDQKVVKVVDKTQQYVALFKDNTTYHFEPAEADNAAFYADGTDVEAVIVITGNLVDNPKAVSINSPQPVSNELLSYTREVLNNEVRRAKLKSYNVPQLDKIIDDVQSDFDIKTVIKKEDGHESASDTNIAIAAGFIFTFLIYLFVMTYGAAVMQSVMEEKTNRIMELMVSSVKPFQLMMGKIIGVALVGFLQLIIWGVMFAVILFICGSIFGTSQVPADPMLTAQTAAMQQSMPSETSEILAAIMNLPFADVCVLFRGRLSALRLFLRSRRRQCQRARRQFAVCHARGAHHDFRPLCRHVQRRQHQWSARLLGFHLPPHLAHRHDGAHPLRRALVARSPLARCALRHHHLLHLAQR